MLSYNYQKKYYHDQIYHCLKVKPSFHEKLFQKKKYSYEFVPGDFQVIWSSMVGDNRQPQLKPLC